MQIFANILQTSSIINAKQLSTIINNLFKKFSPIIRNFMA